MPMSRKKRNNNNMRKSRSCGYRKKRSGCSMSRKTNMMNTLNRKRKGRRSTRRRSLRGGAYDPMQLSLNQGRDFNSMHTNQHGGAYTPLYGAPVGDRGLLPQELRDIARISPLDVKSSEIVGLRDPDQQPINTNMEVTQAVQAGGRRRRCYGRKGRKSRKGKKRNNNNMRKRNNNNSRKMYGGSYRVMGAPYDGPTMLLTPDAAAMAGTGDFKNPLLKY